jgi:hypothetical protein
MVMIGTAVSEKKFMTLYPKKGKKGGVDGLPPSL